MRAIIALAQSLRLRLVAEGVETEAHREFFQREGCDEIQGYLIAWPMPADEAAVFAFPRATRRYRPAGPLPGAMLPGAFRTRA